MELILLGGQRDDKQINHQNVQYSQLPGSPLSDIGVMLKDCPSGNPTALRLNLGLLFAILVMLSKSMNLAQILFVRLQEEVTRQSREGQRRSRRSTHRGTQIQAPAHSPLLSSSPQRSCSIFPFSFHCTLLLVSFSLTRFIPTDFTQLDTQTWWWVVPWICRCQPVPGLEGNSACCSVAGALAIRMQARSFLGQKAFSRSTEFTSWCLSLNKGFVSTSS